MDVPEYIKDSTPFCCLKCGGAILVGPTKVDARAPKPASPAAIDSPKLAIQVQAAAIEPPSSASQAKSAPAEPPNLSTVAEANDALSTTAEDRASPAAADAPSRSGTQAPPSPAATSRPAAQVRKPPRTNPELPAAELTPKRRSFATRFLVLAIVAIAGGAGLATFEHQRSRARSVPPQHARTPESGDQQTAVATPPAGTALASEPLAPFDAGLATVDAGEVPVAGLSPSESSPSAQDAGAQLPEADSLDGGEALGNAGESAGSSDAARLRKIAFAQQRRGDAELALRTLRRAAAKDPESVETFQALGAILAELGQDQDAAKMYRRALRMNPDPKQAAEIRSQLQKLR